MNDYTGKRLFGSWYIRDFNRPLGKGSFGTVYELRSYNSIIDPTAVKIISIPNSWQEYRSLLGAVGADERSVNAKLTQAKDRLINEIAIMLKVSGHSNCVSCMAYDVVPHEDCFGWDVLIQMEKLETLDAYYRRKGTITNFDIVRLGMDMCSALDICAENNIAHRDIKPANIMVKEVGKRVYYKLADFGVAGILRGSGTMTITGTIEYMAPELFRGEGDARVDIYSLGIVLYELLNANRLPLLPDYPEEYEDSDVGEARSRRLKGERLPGPMYEKWTELGKVIVKACEYRPENRFKSAKEMSAALKAAQEKEPEREIFTAPAVGEYKQTERRKKKKPDDVGGRDEPPKPQKPLRRIIIPIILLCVVLAGIFAVRLNDGAKTTQQGEATAEVTTTEAATTELANGLQYTIETDGAVITGYTGSAEEIELPGVISGVRVTTIGEWAFYCTALKTITIPDGVTAIKNHAFSGCTSLTSVTIPNSVTAIGEKAFYDCTALASITIPSSVTSIGENAFDEETTVYYGNRSSYDSTPTPAPSEAQKPSAADLDAVGESITYPKAASYLSEYKTMYGRSENGHSIYVFSKSKGTWTYVRKNYYIYEGYEVTVIAEENGHSCVIYADAGGTKHAGWVNSDYLAAE